MNENTEATTAPRPAVSVLGDLVRGTTIVASVELLRQVEADYWTAQAQLAEMRDQIHHAALDLEAMTEARDTLKREVDRAVQNGADSTDALVQQLQAKELELGALRRREAVLPDEPYQFKVGDVVRVISANHAAGEQCVGREGKVTSAVNQSNIAACGHVGPASDYELVTE